MTMRTIVREMLNKYGPMTGAQLHDKAVFYYSTDDYNPKCIANSHPNKSISAEMHNMSKEGLLNKSNTKPYVYSLKEAYGDCSVELETGEIVRAKLINKDE